GKRIPGRDLLEDVDSIKRALRFDSSRSGDRCRQIKRAADGGRFLAGLKKARPADDARDADAAFERRAFEAVKPGGAGTGGSAVVAGEDHDRFFRAARLFECRKDLADPFVHSLDHPTVDLGVRAALLPAIGVGGKRFVRNIVRPLKWSVWRR